MTPRERLQLAYEYAFCPWRLNQRWRQWLAAPSDADADELRSLDDAARLYLPLPQRPVSSKHALYRLAAYQAGGCEHRMRIFIGNIRQALGRPPIEESEIPVGLIRDVALPRFERKGNK